jgi:hypothetical protein
MKPKQIKATKYSVVALPYNDWKIRKSVILFIRI